VVAFSRVVVIERGTPAPSGKEVGTRDSTDFPAGAALSWKECDLGVNRPGFRCYLFPAL
jgi:hypothetical protein